MGVIPPHHHDPIKIVALLLVLPGFLLCGSCLLLSGIEHSLLDELFT